jgi:hypothetical protein
MSKDEEWDESLWCDDCFRITLFTCERYRNNFSAVCTVCDHQHPTWSDEREQWEENYDDDPVDLEEEGLLVDGCAS